jgi:16S rRNA processing protein RimM
VEHDFASQLVPIGSILKTVGYQGGLLIDTYPGYATTWSAMNKCLIRIDGVWAPFFIVSKEEKSDGILVVFEDLEDNKLAKSLIHQEVYVLQTQLVAETGTSEEASDINTWIGFTIYDVHSDFSAVIRRIEELPSQLLAFVEWNGKEVALPLAEELIVDLNPDQKSLTMNLPDGILEL